MEYAPHPDAHPHAQLDQLDHEQPQLVASTSTNARKRSALDEAASAEAKRLKARERQRRKRERDRAGLAAMQATAYDPDGHPLQSDFSPRASRGQPDDADLSPEQLAKKDKLRKAARERQRKHRAVVKAKRMAEMGLTMGVDPQIAGGYVDPAAYAAAVQMHTHPDMHDSDDPGMQVEPDLPQQQPNASPGQTFASLMLLSFSCAPLLKQHLLRTLNMTDEELTSLKPILAASWEQWNHERTMQYQQDDQDVDSPYANDNGTELQSPYAPDEPLQPESAPDPYRPRYQRVAYPTHHHSIDPSLHSHHHHQHHQHHPRDDELDSPHSHLTRPEIDPELGQAP
ncbi:hypothetical protein EXIGLDRAFT_832684 [Exidia glandulosa HHB12029]|uniref:Uncharacterized protein n=1 Tax=Exidia glandulosa HHB12029 TaxID=1314781 RepID=A0A165LC05_EXIGL|nr:hypothetical protein EXIGLDRAFT_832684 [Exidia glandulosa HHB12029]